MSRHTPYKVLRERNREDRANEQEIADYATLVRQGMKLAELRRRMGKTQSQHAKEMAVAQANVSRIEHGDDARISTLQKYARALGGELDVRVVFPES